MRLAPVSNRRMPSSRARVERKKLITTACSRSGDQEAIARWSYAQDFLREVGQELSVGNTEKAIGVCGVERSRVEQARGYGPMRSSSYRVGSGVAPEKV